MSPPSEPRRRRWPMLVAMVVAAPLVAAGIVLAASDGSAGGPPGPPGKLRAVTDVCSAPTCERIVTTVALSWTRPDGELEAFEIVRDGAVLVEAGPRAVTVEIDDLLIDRSYTFGVRAVGDGGTGPTRVSVDTPVPPLAEAQLTGSYRVRERVRSATNLSGLEGIDDPRPGRTIANTWGFSSVCAGDAGACPTRWFSWGPLAHDQDRYDGSFHGRPARCAGGKKTPTTVEMHLVVERGRAADGRWLVGRFHGTTTVSFSCPEGGARSVGTLELEARAII